MRLGDVQKELGKAVASIEREKAGLGRRLDEARLRAASLMGNADGIFDEREAASEKMLVEAEAEMMNAYRRLTLLDTHHALLTSTARNIADSTGIGIATLPSPAPTLSSWRGTAMRHLPLLVLALLILAAAAIVARIPA